MGLLLLTGVVCAYIEFDASKLQQGLLWVQENKTKGWIIFLVRGSSGVEGWIVVGWGVGRTRLYCAAPVMMLYSQAHPPHHFAQVAYTLGVVFMLPAMVLGMLAGAVFGFVPGTLLGWVGSSVGQTLAFVAGRYLLREAVASYLTRQFPQWTAIDRALESEAWKLVTLLRLSPLAPWNVLNYALAVTAVPLGKYALASSLAIVPYLALFTYAGSLARSLADVFAGETGLDARSTLIVAAISSVLMVLGVWYTTRVSRRAIVQALMSHGSGLPPELTSDADVIALLRVADVVDEVEEARSPGAWPPGPDPTVAGPTTPKSNRRKDSGPEGSAFLLAKDVEMAAVSHDGAGALSPARNWAHSAARQRSAPLAEFHAAAAAQD